MTKFLFSNLAFAFSPPVGVLLCRFLVPNDRIYAIGIHHVLLMSMSFTMVMILKHLGCRKRPCVSHDTKQFVERKKLRVIQEFLRYSGPDASFPSGDAAAVTSFALPFIVAMGGGIYAIGVAMAMVILVGFARIYFMAHYVSDIVAGVTISCVCHWVLSELLGCGIGDVDGRHVMVAHGLFVVVGLLRRSNQK